MVILVLCCVNVMCGIFEYALCCLSAGISRNGSTYLLRFFSMNVFLWSLLQTTNNIYLKYRDYVCEYIFVTTNNPLKNSSINSVYLSQWTPYSHEAYLRPRLWFCVWDLSLRSLKQCGKQHFRGRNTLHCSRKKLQMYLNNTQPKQYFLPYRLFFTDQHNAF